MQVSVVVATHAMARYPALREAVESALEQSHDPVELVVVVDGTEAVARRAEQEFGRYGNVRIHCLPENRGVSAARTRGAELATGEVVAFLDDDAIAEPDWIERLVAAYDDHDALAVGGRMTGDWRGGRPWHLPTEFDWLVGVTYPDFAEAGAEVRNTFESNLSVRRDVFLELGGFDPDLGPTADRYRHGEGAAFGDRLRAEYDRGVVYVPDAVVAHTVFEYRTRPWFLAQRAFQQGLSKRRLDRTSGGPTDSDSTERNYLGWLIRDRVPRRLRGIVESPSVRTLGELLALALLTVIVGLGYLWGWLEELG